MPTWGSGPGFKSYSTQNCLDKIGREIEFRNTEL